MNIDLSNFAGISAATMHEALGGIGALPSAIKPLSPDMRVIGPAYPVQCIPGDNLALHLALATAPQGSVLIADAGGSIDYGPWGEVMTVSAKSRGLSGFIIFGAVRDYVEIQTIKFPVFASGICLRGTKKAFRPEQIPSSIRIGETDIRLGDLILGDADGVVVIPVDMIAEAPARCQARIEKEAEQMQRLKAGATTVELFGL